MAYIFYQYKISLYIVSIVCSFLALTATANDIVPPCDTVQLSTATAALNYLQHIKKLKQSDYWPNVNPDIFLENLNTFTVHPFQFYEGKTTNFCSYSALTYIPLAYDPLGFAKFMVELYQKGSAHIGKVLIMPSKSVRVEAGLLRYKGALDINAAGQMWFLSLADHFKGYLNFFNQRFQKGDENTFWASTNYAKFNRMLRRLFPAKVKAVGSDLIRPFAGNIFEYLKKQMTKGTVFVYLNNKNLYTKTHTSPFISTPTHYVLLTGISITEDGNIEFIYWDYGLKTLQHISPSFLKKIVYGITTWNYKKQN
jgi:hypothetical protein